VAREGPSSTHRPTAVLLHGGIPPTWRTEMLDPHGRFWLRDQDRERSSPHAGRNAGGNGRTLTRPAMVAAALVATLLLSAAPAVFAAGVTHKVSAGGPDICRALGSRPGCDANFALSAIQYADGSVRGTFTDRFGSFGGVHGVIDCLSIIGNEAWASGVITSGLAVGLPYSIRLRDLGTSAQQPPDQITPGHVGGGAVPCTAHPDYELFDDPDGQVTVV
jgi:hypothetical protein